MTISLNGFLPCGAGVPLGPLRVALPAPRFRDALNDSFPCLNRGSSVAGNDPEFRMRGTDCIATTLS
ncbi:hypothetical protein [Modicisalibacter radicis]|uniref:hypothetical protein n=1 Tax=Halomonas sp. EAR18 TaxID=2518972 RepID=UPI00109C703A|nr:hypothetical protein [Halomonas sp. EAR18]